MWSDIFSGKLKFRVKESKENKINKQINKTKQTIKQNKAKKISKQTNTKLDCTNKH